MKKYSLNRKTNAAKCIRLVFILMVSFSLVSTATFEQRTKQDNAPAISSEGTSKTWGKIDGISIQGLVEGPATAVTPLQIACVFEYTEGDIFNSPPALPAALNGVVHLDEALNGIITDLRKSGKFSGHTFETIVITPPAGKLKAPKLLLIGLGDRNKFTPGLMISVGSVALREAMNAGVTNFAFASDLKDGGIASPTAVVAGNIARGIRKEYGTQEFLKGKKMGG